MLSIEALREDGQAIQQKLHEIRGYELDLLKFQQLDADRKAIQIQTQEWQRIRNQVSKQIGQHKSQGLPIEPLLAQVADLGQQLESGKQQLNELLASLDQLLLNIPNIPDPSVPAGRDEQDNQVAYQVGEPTCFDFTPLSHDAIGVQRQLMAFDVAAKITGSRFVVLKSAVARLHRALAQWMLDLHTTQHGYEEVYVPYLVNRDSLQGTGQLPKFAEDLFQIAGEQTYFLTSTGEVPVLNMVRDQIIAAEDLPLKWVAHTPCFRSEAGSYGKDTKGMIRQHQFEKVELIWVTSPELSSQAHEQLTLDAEAVLKALDLPYRRVLLCGGDLGFTATKTYDLEVWLPSQQCYREISSCSNCEGFQARRMQARYRLPDKSLQHVHTLNGSGLAVGRTLVAIIENYQTVTGEITVPEILRPYMGGASLV